MTSESDPKYYGDSVCTNSLRLELKLRKSNHIFDEAGENVQYHSDSESTASRKSRTRYINPAIYIENVESTRSSTSLHSLSNGSCIEEMTPHPHSSYRSNSTPYLTGRVSSPCPSSHSIRRKCCRLAGLGKEETPRCDRTYREDGHDTFRLSVTSLSTDTTAKEERERNEQKKQEAFKAWLARKEQEKREKARQEKLKQREAPRTSAAQREESYRQWLATKRRQKEQREAEVIVRKFRESERAQQERERREREKQDKLNDWIKKKEEDIKLMKTKEERKAARAALEEERRRSAGERAYRDWLRTSRNKPLPVPLNQGELSMRGSVSQMYVNPIPWQSTI